MRRHREEPVHGGPRANGLVLFDLDDTLYDHRHASLAALRALQRDYRSLDRWPLDRLAAQYATLLEEVHARLLARAITLAEARTARMRRLFGLAGEPISDTEAQRRSDRFRAAYRLAERPVPGALALLRRLSRRHRVGIVSNNRTSEQRGKLRRTGLASFVSFLVTSEEVGATKPDARIFLSAVERGGGGAAVMVGDSWTADVRGALDAGLSAVWYNPDGRPLPEPLPVPTVERWLPAGEVAERIVAAAEPNLS